MKYLRRNGTDDIEDDPLTSRVIGIAIEVHKEIGPGFPEAFYHRAMEIDLGAAGINFLSEAPYNFKYRNRMLGKFELDMVVEGCLLLEFKALENLPQISEIQVVQYLKASGLNTGLILNFGTSTLQIKRKYRTLALPAREIRFREV